MPSSGGAEEQGCARKKRGKVTKGRNLSTERRRSKEKAVDSGHIVTYPEFHTMTVGFK